MQNKHMIALIIFAVALVSLLFLPFITMFGQSVSLLDTIDAGGIDILFADTPSMMLTVALVGAILGIVGGAMKNNNLCIAGGAMGIVGQILFLFLNADSDYGISVGDIADLMGFGFWLALVAFIAGTVFVSMKKD